MKKGKFREAFQKVVDSPVDRPDHLFEKTGLISDAGVALADPSMLEYGLYLLEKNSTDILAVPYYTTAYWFNTANLRTNLLAVNEHQGRGRDWYRRTHTSPARHAYHMARNSVQDDPDMASRILNAHGNLLMGLGRDWEAFGLFHESGTLSPERADSTLGRSQALYSIAGTAPSLSRVLRAEAWSQLVNLEIPAEHTSLEQQVSALKHKLKEGQDPSAQPPPYPRNSIVTQTDTEHFRIMFALKHKLYLNACSLCRNCDRAVGDTATLGMSHALLGNNGTQRFRNLATLIGRLSERYRALRGCLVDLSQQAGNSENLAQRHAEPEIKGWKSADPAATRLVNALSGAHVLFQGMAACVTVFLGDKPDDQAAVPEHVLGTPDHVPQPLLASGNAALHGFWDLWHDGLEGRREGTELVNLSALPLTDNRVEDLCTHPGQLVLLATGFLSWIRDLVAYLVRMVDRDASGNSDVPPLWPLQPFVIPGK